MSIWLKVYKYVHIYRVIMESGVRAINLTISSSRVLSEMKICISFAYGAKRVLGG
jgi:hypothetical protein